MLEFHTIRMTLADGLVWEVSQRPEQADALFDAWLDGEDEIPFVVADRASDPLRAGELRTIETIRIVTVGPDGFVVQPARNPPR